MVNPQKHFKKAEHRIVTISAFLMAFFLPLHIGISNLFLILFFVGSGYFLILKKQYVFRNPKILLFSLLPIFLLYILGLFYSSPPFFGTNIIGRNIAFLLCPLLLFFYSSKDLKQVKKNLFKGIIFGSVVSISILLVDNFLNYFGTRPFLNFDDEIFNYYHTYYSFTNLLEMHPTYLGAYIIFSLSLLLKKLITTKTHKLPTILALLLLTSGVVFINSRIIFSLYVFLIFSTLLFSLFLLYKKRKNRILTLVMFVTVMAVFSIVKILSNTFIGTRLTNELQWELTDQRDTNYNKKITADSRIARWQSSIEAISKKPVFGYGTYSEKDVLSGYYKRNGLLISYKNRYDSHNIYLSFLVEYGILGLSLLLLYLISNLYFALKAKDIEYFIFFAMICVVSIFESYLQNNAAVTFVALFGSVFLYSVFPEKLKKKNV